jgi:hypothetical protein
VVRFKWRADFYEASSGARATKSTTIEANNADAVERLAKAAAGTFGRVEISRIGTAGPVRVVFLSAPSTPEIACPSQQPRMSRMAIRGYSFVIQNAS